MVFLLILFQTVNEVAEARGEEDIWLNDVTRLSNKPETIEVK